MIGQGLDGVQVHDETIRKLRGVIEVDEELDWFDVASEVSNVGVSNLTDVSCETVLKEALDEKLMINSDEFWHNLNSRLAYDILLRDA